MVLKRKSVEALVISVVDDDVSFRTSVRRLLQSFGFKVLTFESARQFLTSKTRYSSKCLLLDVDLPDLNGFQVAEQLLSGNHKLPLVLLSGKTTEGDFQRAKRLGVLFLQKPVNAEILRKTVKRLCRPPPEH